MLSHVERVLDGEYLWPSQLTRHVAVQIAYEADRHGVCRASQGEIAAAVGTSRRSVARALVQLEGDGLVIREGHGRYVLCPEWRGRAGTGPQHQQPDR